MDSGRLDLQAVGTRFDHYMELKEIFMLGVDVIDRMRPAYTNDNDRALKVKLQIAVEMINKRLDNLSEFSEKTSDYSELAKEVRRAGIHRPLMLTEGSDVKSQEPQNSNQPDTEKDSTSKTDISQ